MRRPSIQALVTGAVVALSAGFVFTRLEPSLLFANTTPSGGDMGAQVWAPAFMRDHLLPHGRLMGWAPDWYAGFPAFTFYFPLPSLLIVLLDVLLPYGVAFKLVSVLGALALPVAAYAFGRLSGLRFPGPPLLAVATLPFLFDTSFTIYGGNIASLLAGEFAFSLSLSLALIFLGVLSRGFETGRHRALAAALLALTVLSHLIPAIFAVGAAFLLLIFRLDRHRLRYFIAVTLFAGMLVAFWALPLVARLAYANDMGWEKITEYGKTLFPSHMKWVLPLAVAGVLAAFGLRLYSGVAIAAMGSLAGLGFLIAPEGRLWNARLLPFWFLCLYLLAGFGVAEVGRALGGLFSRDPDRPSVWPSLATPAIALIATIVMVGGPLQALPKWLPIRPGQASFVPDWTRWNYSGYERKATYPEYRSVIDTMGRLPCGRAMWEYNSDLNRYGTPMALMLLPYWTDGCIGSMEGLYFESSATVPFHFINQSELSKQPSKPQRGLPYPGLNVANGVKHLQLLGVRYYMATSPEIVAQARSHPDLKHVATSAPWEIFEVADSPLVSALSFQPVVLNPAGQSQADWLPTALDFYSNPDKWDVFLAADGPGHWERIHRKQLPARHPIPPAVITAIRSTGDRVSFNVDRPGSPVLVKVSYFPNWKARGADGPWRVTPNLMVVVPTHRHVQLYYGYTAVDVAGWLLTLAGLFSVALVARLRLVRQEQATPSMRPMPEGRVRLSVVIPAFNEVARIAATVTRVRSALASVVASGGVEVIVVDDGSIDDTASKARAVGADRVIALSRNRGKGAALRAGVLASRGRTVAFLDADLSYSPDQLTGLLHRVEAGWDVAVGSRKHTKTITLIQAKRLREVSGRLFNALTRALLLGQYRDTQCGIKAFRSDVARLLFTKSRLERFALDVELFHLAERYRLSLTEVPVIVTHSETSTVHLVLDAVRMIADVFRIRRWGGKGLYDLTPEDKQLIGPRPGTAIRRRYS